MNNNLSPDLIQLKDLLRQGEVLFTELFKVEEQLRDYIIKGDHRGVMETQDYRDTLQVRLVSFEKKGLSLVPEGTELSSFIESNAKGKDRKQLLSLYQSVNDKLNQINMLHNINKSLLEERIRFTKELQKVLLPKKDLYNDRGQLKDNHAKDTLNINKTC